jgi:L,D-peptidoglycan transpeptidase YkuD (ErfK/YbiS/YcfS/YnhG family)
MRIGRFEILAGSAIFFGISDPFFEMFEPCFAQANL